MSIIKTFDEYKSYYEQTGKLPLPQVNYNQKPLNERQLLTKFKDYEKKISRQEEKLLSLKEEGLDSVCISDYTRDLMKAKNLARELDPKGEIQFKFLTVEEKNYIHKNSWGVFGTLDPAHIFPTSKYPHLGTDQENIIMLNRFCHTLIDSYKSIFDDKHSQLTEEEHTNLWIKIIGNTRYNNLLKKL